MGKRVITIDGPSGAGKSTISRILAHHLGYTYLDTGAMYRAVALKTLRFHLDLRNETELRALLSNLNLSFKGNKDGFHIFLDGKDVTHEIRTPEIGMQASYISSNAVVRETLWRIQRQIGEEGNVILEGRDMGTVVFPDAEVKFFLVASPEVRALRRHRELLEQGKSIEWQEVFEDVIKRDVNDTKRDLSPLRPAEDAIIIDSTQMSIEEVKNTMLKILKERMLRA
ncbi:MAG TPA: (d)CMP kinase [Syntrophaceae bacterium]|nr:(d)CMP kinase [Syntrophaceae bacterium]